MYGSEVTARDIRTQATPSTPRRPGCQSAIFRANATLETSVGDYAAAAYRAGGTAANAGSQYRRRCWPAQRPGPR